MRTHDSFGVIGIFCFAAWLICYVTGEYMAALFLGLFAFSFLVVLPFVYFVFKNLMTGSDRK